MRGGNLKRFHPDPSKGQKGGEWWKDMGKEAVKGAVMEVAQPALIRSGRGTRLGATGRLFGHPRYQSQPQSDQELECFDSQNAKVHRGESDFVHETIPRNVSHRQSAGAWRGDQDAVVFQ